MAVIAAIASLLGSALPSAGAPCGTAETVHLTARDGHPLHLLRYRPAEGATAGIVLVHDWGASGEACWKDLPQALCDAGFEVLVPDLRGHGKSIAADAAGASTPAPTRVDLALLAADAPQWGQAFSDAITQIVVAGVGWGGTVATRVASPARRLTGFAWLGPAGDAAAVDWQPTDPARRSLLMIATQDDAASARCAEALYARYHANAELRSYSHGSGGCALLDAPGARDGLLEWLRQAAAGSAGR